MCAARSETWPLAGSLPGDAQGGGDPVPAPPVCPGGRDALGQQRFIAPRTFGGLGYGPQVSKVFHLCGLRVERVRECLEPARRFLDLGVGVLHLITSSSQEPVELGPER